ncbi:phosphatidate cytidylyltransferase [Phaeocystidibacter luteus]|uniref:Phosphatidate cytidylyltransferase n=1 Tax=Phaeocystidibacter luteus TaxID=911197 RepID=A0A6N6RKC2_9FLAO|nr:phosphatidate cytidylyltransferase [Phaeocystidibacter luteus]KAB2809886.1 CDP-archaeol synthase [Phaeocystidibacter luteus]
MSVYLYIIAALAGVGAIMNVFAIRRSSVTPANAWKKYGVFVSYVALLVFSLFLHPDYRLLLYAVLGCIGLVEFASRILRSNWKVGKILSILLYLQIILGFVLSAQMPQETIADVILTVIVFDSFSQLFGQLFGKKKLIPKVSPGKTVGGTVGGFFSALLVSLLVFYSKSSPKNSVVGHVLIVTSYILYAFLGDFIASWIKRKLNIKDFGDWLPGTGGWNDRFDSVFFALSLSYLFSQLL